MRSKGSPSGLTLNGGAGSRGGVRAVGGAIGGGRGTRGKQCQCHVLSAHTETNGYLQAHVGRHHPHLGIWVVGGGEGDWEGGSRDA